GGPAGLYFALLMKKADPGHDVTLLERNRADDTFGWGVVFSSQTLGNPAEADPEAHAALLDSFPYWDHLDGHVKGRTVTSGGHGFCGIARKRLLNILQERCRALGVKLAFESEVKDADALAADLVVASDGANSAIRARHAATFQPDIDVRKCRYVW